MLIRVIEKLFLISQFFPIYHFYLDNESLMEINI